MLEPVRRYFQPVIGSESIQDQSVRDPIRPRLLGGGIDGNEWLTTATGVLLIVLLAVLGITIVQIGQLIWLHLFLGLLLLGPVALKMASTGYRFMRYYTRSDRYVERGPPMLVLRALAPVLVVSTVIVFASGIVLLFNTPRSRGIWLSVHKVSFIVWLVFTALHLLGHLPRLGQLLGVGSASREPALAGGDGALGRWLVLGGAIIAGAVLAIVLIPDFGAWTAPDALHHHHHG
jgi:hypothetical protein